MDYFLNFLSSLKSIENGVILESIENGFNVILESVEEEYERQYPIVRESEIDGLHIRETVPNMNSISSTLTDYKILPGIRKVKMTYFNASPHEMFYSKSDIDRVKVLSKEISESKEINPLIVVVDSDGPYILEGAHRLSALYLLKVSEFPAVVVLDL